MKADKACYRQTRVIRVLSIGFIVLGETSLAAENHELASGIQGHAPREFFEMNMR